MRPMRWNPDRMHGRHDPLLVSNADRQQAAQRAKQLAAGMLMRGRDARIRAAAFDSDKERPGGGVRLAHGNQRI